MAHNNFIESKRRGRFFRYAPLFLWIGVIFFLSSGQGSTTRTSPLIRPLLEFIFPGATEEILIIYQGYIRKFAHFAEYAALAFFASRAFWNSAIVFLRKFWQLAAFVLVFTIAAIDEYNQSFNSLRTGSVYDVLIDLSGGLIMILLLVFYKLFCRK
ncbi:MAG: VanZ family protein [Pyrinomonadaceae bacterium]